MLVVSGPQTFGGLLSDTMGLGKTLTALLFLVLSATSSHINMKDQQPSLLICSSEVVLSQ